MVCSAYKWGQMRSPSISFIGHKGHDGGFCDQLEFSIEISGTWTAFFTRVLCLFEDMVTGIATYLCLYISLPKIEVLKLFATDNMCS